MDLTSAPGKEAPSPHARILVVDDHNLVREGLVSLLCQRWDVCGEAANGIEAIEKVGELKPDLVLLDLSMPLMSGTRAAQVIRAVSPGTSIVILSMHDGPTVMELAKAVGADAFLSKRCSATELLEVVGSFLEPPLHS